jgi:hypothetical protein
MPMECCFMEKTPPALLNSLRTTCTEFQSTS